MTKTMVAIVLYVYSLVVANISRIHFPLEQENNNVNTKVH